MERDKATEKKPYETPKLTVHGDVEKITLGTEVGETLDGAFTNSINPRGTKQPPRQSVFS